MAQASLQGMMKKAQTHPVNDLAKIAEKTNMVAPSICMYPGAHFHN